MKFLLVEDDKMLADAIKQLLAEHHYVMDSATDGIAGRDMAESFAYDLILLDWTLPKLDGMQLCQHLRKQGNDTPIILMTARDASTDRVAGLDAGADDYLVKPFEFEELLARIRALLRRAEGLVSPILQWGDLSLDPRSSEVTCRHLPIAVTPKEYALLELFLRNPNRIFSLDTLLDKVWPFEDSPTVGSVRTHIKGLRQKLRKAELPDMIATVYGLGYRLKPSEAKSKMETEPEELRPESAASSASPLVDTAESSAESTDPLDMASLWRTVSESYDQRVTSLVSTLRALLPGPVDSTVQQQILHEVHALAGSLGSFGFREATTNCRKIENVFQANPALSTQHIAQLKSCAALLQQTMERSSEASENVDFAPQTTSARGFVLEPVSVRLSDEPSSEQPYSMLIIESHENYDRDWLQTLASMSARHQIQVSVVSNIAQAQQTIIQQSPKIVVFDLDGAVNLPDSNSAEFQLLAELQASYPPVPVLILTAAASFENRVKMARLGVTGLLQVPVTPTEVVETAMQILQKSVPLAGKLLIVDDDLAMLTLLQVLLQPWGFQLQVLSEPQRFWQILEDFEPDLVLLDAKMPDLSGFDLCQVLRSAPRWQDLPVLFMSGYTDAATIQQVFASGADDYIRKPIVAPELVARVLGWLKRAHLQRLQANVDSLTGVANRRKSTQSLNRLLKLAQRQRQALCFALIDFDHFKQINDSYGHPVGDRILRRFGESLRSTFRAEDVVGRWGGEEFIVGLYGVSRQEGAQRLEAFLRAWQQEQFAVVKIVADEKPADTRLESQTHGLSATFTAGIAAYPEDADDLQGLYWIADEALYKAKAAGRNCIGTSESNV